MNTYCMAVIRNQKELMPGIWKMELEAPEIAHSARPGQFIQMYPPDERNLLARPISLAAIHGESVEVVYRVVGKGTEQFSRLRDNDTVQLMGPLGNGFTLPEAGERSAIIGGGLGIPPLLELSKGFRERRRFSWAMRMPRSWTGISGDMAGRSMWRARPGMEAFAGRCWSLWRPSRLWRTGYMPVVPGRCCRPWQNGQKGRASRFRYPWRNGWPAA